MKFPDIKNYGIEKSEGGVTKTAGGVTLKDINEYLPRQTIASVLSDMTGRKLTDDVINRIHEMYMGNAEKSYDLNTDFDRIQTQRIPTAWDKNYRNTEIDNILYQNGLPPASKFNGYAMDAVISLDTELENLEKEEQKQLPHKQYRDMINAAVRNADSFYTQDENGNRVLDEELLLSTISDELTPEMRELFIKEPEISGETPEEILESEIMAKKAKEGKYTLRGALEDFKSRLPRSQKDETYAAAVDAQNTAEEAPTKQSASNFISDPTSNRFLGGRFVKAEDVDKAVAEAEALKTEKQKKKDLDAQLKSRMEEMPKITDYVAAWAPDDVLSAGFTGGTLKHTSEQEKAYKEAVFQEFRDTGLYTDLEIMNAFNRTGNAGQLEDLKNNIYIEHTLMQAGLSADEAKEKAQSLPEEYRQKIIENQEYDNAVQEDFSTEITRAVVSTPIRAGLGIASGIAGAIDLINGIGNPNVDQLEISKALMEQSHKMQQFGTNEDYSGANFISLVGSEVLRMYALGALGSAVGAGSSATQTGSQLLMNKFANYAINSSPFLISATGNYFNQAMADGASRPQATAFAIAAGAIEGGLEALGADKMFGKALGPKLTNRMISATQAALGSHGSFALIEIGKAVLGNAVEEGASYVATGILESAIYNPDRELSVKEFLTDAAMGAVIGFVGGTAGTMSYMRMADEGFTPQRFDDAAFEFLVNEMSEAERGRVAEAKRLDHEKYRITSSEVYKSIQAIEAAEKSKAEAVQRYTSDYDKAFYAYLEADRKVKAIDPRNATIEDLAKLRIAFDERNSRERTLINMKETSEAKITGAQREYDSIIANNEKVTKDRQRALNDHALAHDLERRVTENAEVEWAGIVPYNDHDAANRTSQNGITANEMPFNKFVEISISSDNQQRYYFGKISGEMADALLVSTGINARGYNLVIRSNEIRHILAEHGSIDTEAPRGQVPIDENILQMLPLAFNSPDNISLQTKTDYAGRKAIQVEKRLENGYAVVVNGVSKGRWSLEVDSMWLINKKGPPHTSDVAEQPQTNARNEHEASPINNNIPQDTQNMQASWAMGAARAGEFEADKLVSQAYENTMKNLVGEDVLEQAGITPEEMSYFPMTEQDYEASAQYVVDSAIKKGMDAEIDRLANIAGNWGPVESVAARRLLSLAAEDGNATGDYSRVRELAQMIREHATETAQTLQSFAMDNRTAEGMLYEAQKNVDKAEADAPKKVRDSINSETQAVKDAIESGEDVESKVKDVVKGKGSKDAVEEIMTMAEEGTATPQQINNVIKQKYGLPIITDAEMQDIMRLMEQSKTATNPYDQKRYMRQAAQIVADKNGKTMQGKIRAFRQIMMLLNPKTISKNFFANIPMGLLENIKDVPATLVDMAVSKQTGERTTGVSWDRLKAEGAGFVKGMGEAVKDIRYGVNTSGMLGEKMPGRYEGVQGNAFNNEVLNTLQRVTGGLMQTGDRGFYQAAFDGRMATLQKLGVDVNTDKAVMDANLHALDRVFQNNSALAGFASGLRKDLNKLSVGGIGFGDLAIPFVQTPANIADKLFDYSPVGLIRAFGTKSKQTKQSGSFDQKLFVDRVGRSVTGTGALLLGAAMVAKGLIIPNEGEEKKEREAYRNAGVEGYSIRLGDHTYTIDWAEPAGSLLVMGAAAYKIWKEAQEQDYSTMKFVDWLDLGMDTISTGANAFFNNTFLQNITGLLSGYDPAESLLDLLFNSVTQFTPSGLGTVARISDEYERETYDPSDFIEAGNKVMARIPGLRNLLPEKIDTAGQPIMAGGIGERVLQNTLSPGYYDTRTDDKIHSELFRLYEETGASEQLLPVAEKKLYGHTLGAEEYNQYQRELGEEAYKAARAIISSSNYKGLKDAERVKRLENAIKEAKSGVNAKWKKQLSGESSKPMARAPLEINLLGD